MAQLYWKGASLLDGNPIMLVVTGVKRKSENQKIGDIIQTWILTADIPPNIAVQLSLDVAICGTCPNRHATGGGCYVLPWQAPTTIWKSAYGNEPDATLPQAIKQSGKLVRLGAYGDPCAVPRDIWKALLSDFAVPAIGYTHQWRQTYAQWAKGRLMASTTNKDETLYANLTGWTTFQAVPIGKPSPINYATECASSEGIACDKCRKCDGKSGNIFIGAHGSKKSSI